ncbi:MAG: conjugal transfer protein TraB, partial [Nitrosarchaeum sp.]|nr:conjugal transfer protein TraB [Nitrosarchaeum sp.]
MMERKVVVVGTSHVASESVRKVREAFDDERPWVVAVELDARRLAGLVSEERPSASVRLVREVGWAGFVFG